MDAPSSTRRLLAVAFFLAFAVCLCWPVFYTGTVFTFVDTSSYLRGGEKIWDVFLRLFSSPEVAQHAGSGGDAAPNALTVNTEGKNVAGRSFSYSAFANILFRVAGPVSLALAQAALATLMISYLVSRSARQSPAVLAVGALFIAAFTALPWYASFLMPDVLGGFVVLFGVILVRQIDELGIVSTILLVALAGFAASAHYGNMPLILSVVVAALGLRLLRRRLSWKSVIAGVIAIGIAPLSNLGASTVVLKEASVTPRRLPIVLARSLADGPALWYLQDVCPEADLALCEAYGDKISADTGWFLWSDEGVLSLTPEQLDRVRREEVKVLIGAFMAYPLAQSKAFLRNGAVQLFRIGTDGLAPSYSISPDYEIERAKKTSFPYRVSLAFDQIIPIATWASAALLAIGGLVLGFSARWKDMILVLGTGLLANAYIYGGLSAPIDRYQGRMAWIIPLLAVLFFAEAATERRQRKTESPA